MNKYLQKIIDEAIEETVDEIMKEDFEKSDKTSVDDFVFEQKKWNNNLLVMWSVLNNRIQFLNKIVIFQGILLAVSFFMIAFLWIR